MSLTLQHQLTPRQVGQLVELFQSAWWTVGRVRADVEDMLAATDLLFVYSDEAGDLAGFARVLTDRAYKATIYDVIVRPDLRGQSVGDRILADIKAHPDLAKVRHIDLYCRPELEGFYARHGFTCNLGGVVAMRLSRGG